MAGSIASKIWKKTAYCIWGLKALLPLEDVDCNEIFCSSFACFSFLPKLGFCNFMTVFQLLMAIINLE